MVSQKSKNLKLYAHNLRQNRELFKFGVIASIILILLIGNTTCSNPIGPNSLISSEINIQRIEPKNEKNSNSKKEDDSNSYLLSDIESGSRSFESSSNNQSNPAHNKINENTPITTEPCSPPSVDQVKTAEPYPGYDTDVVCDCSRRCGCSDN